METYYISTGLYQGSASELTSTEIIRYFGIDQRNMSTVISREFDPQDFLEYSLSPLTSISGEDLGGLGTSYYGYTANNIIAYAYHDAGLGMWLLLFVWSAAVQISYMQFIQCRSSLIRSYWWATMAMSLAMSFFAYFNAYAYWMLVFPIVVSLLQLVCSKPGQSHISAEKHQRSHVEVVS
jgi:hypothetical protein